MHLNECAKYTRPPKKAKWTVKREFGSVGGVDSPLNAAATFSGAKRQKTARMVCFCLKFQVSSLLFTAHCNTTKHRKQQIFESHHSGWLPPKPFAMSRVS